MDFTCPILFSIKQTPVFVKNFGRIRKTSQKRLAFRAGFAYNGSNEVRPKIQRKEPHP